MCAHSLSLSLFLHKTTVFSLDGAKLVRTTASAHRNLYCSIAQPTAEHHRSGHFSPMLVLTLPQSFPLCLPIGTVPVQRSWLPGRTRCAFSGFVQSRSVYPAPGTASVSSH